MAENKPSREHLIRRRDEINEQMNGVNSVQRIELDRDPEEQAIQLEQQEVANSMEANLRREVSAIEDELLRTEEEGDGDGD